MAWWRLGGRSATSGRPRGASSWLALQPLQKWVLKLRLKSQAVAPIPPRYPGTATKFAGLLLATGWGDDPRLSLAASPTAGVVVPPAMCQSGHSLPGMTIKIAIL